MQTTPNLYLKAREGTEERLSGHSNTEAEANGTMGFFEEEIELAKEALVIGERLGDSATNTMFDRACLAVT